MLAEEAAQTVGDLADGGVHARRIQDRRHQVIAAAAGAFERRKFLRHRALAAPRALLAQAFHLCPFERRVQPESRHDTLFFLLEAVHPHHHTLAAFDAPLVVVSRILNLLLDVPGLDGAQRAARLLDALQVLVHPAYDGIRERGVYEY